MANTTDAQLVTDHRITELATTFMQNRLAYLPAFTTKFGTDPLKPRATVQVEVVTAGGTAQSNATNFEDTTNFVGTTVAVPVTVAQITAGGHITNAERQGGSTLDNWLEAKLGEFCDKIADVVFMNITEANFGSPIVSSAAESFGPSELKSLWASVAKASKKTCVLDSDFYARFLPSNLQDFDPLKVAGMPGWNYFLAHTKWDQAGANLAGFACAQSALAIASGLPIVSPNAARFSQVREIPLPQLGLTVQTTTWWSNSSRSDWFTFDVMIGAAKADGNALKLVKRT